MNEKKDEKNQKKDEVSDNEAKDVKSDTEANESEDDVQEKKKSKKKGDDSEPEVSENEADEKSKKKTKGKSKSKTKTKSLAKAKSESVEDDENESDNEEEEEEEEEEEGGKKKGQGNIQTRIAKLTFNALKTKKRIVAYFENQGYGKPRFRNASYVYMCSILENICRLIYECAGKEAIVNKKGNKKLVRPTIKRGIRNNIALNQLFMNALSNFDKSADYDNITIITNNDAKNLLDKHFEGMILSKPAIIYIKYLVNSLFVRMNYLANEFINGSIDKTVLFELGLIEEDEKPKKKIKKENEKKSSKKSSKKTSKKANDEDTNTDDDKMSEKSISLTSAIHILNSLMVNSSALVKGLNKKSLNQCQSSTRI